MRAIMLGRELGIAAANNFDEDYTLGWLGFDDAAIDRLEEAGIEYGSIRWILAELAACRAFKRTAKELELIKATS
jgi:hypothetical protein